MYEHSQVTYDVFANRGVYVSFTGGARTLEWIEETMNGKLSINGTVAIVLHINVSASLSNG